MSLVLFDEHPIAVSPKLARIFGLEAAVFLQQLHYWLEHKRKFPDNYPGSFHDGYAWVYKSHAKWLHEMPFLGSRSTFQRMTKALRECGVLVVDNFNQLEHDNTPWYRIDYQVLLTLVDEYEQPVIPQVKMTTPRVKMTRPPGQNDLTYTRDYTETTKPETTIKTPYSPPAGDDGRMRNFSGDDSGDRNQAEAGKQESHNSQTVSANPESHPRSSAPPPSPVDRCFERFWELYPKKAGKQAALKAWKRMAADAKKLALADLQERPKQDPQWLKNAGEFIPNPATYLNQGRYEDEWRAAACTGATGALAVENPKTATTRIREANEARYRRRMAELEAEGAQSSPGQNIFLIGTQNEMRGVV